MKPLAKHFETNTNSNCRLSPHATGRYYRVGPSVGVRDERVTSEDTGVRKVEHQKPIDLGQLMRGSCVTSDQFESILSSLR